jgi:hypothetical protein
MNQPWSSLAVPPDGIIIAQNGSPLAYVLPDKPLEASQPSPAAGNNAPCTLNSNKYTFYTFGQWQTQAGEDVHSLVQNPGFNNPAYPADDYSLPKGSPGVGFVIFDPTQAGRSNPVINPPAVSATFLTMTLQAATDY